MERSSQKYKITYILIAINIAVYIYTSIVGGDFLTTSDSMVLEYGQVNYLIFNYGSMFYYQLLSAIFIHANISHIVGNMLFLLIFGLRAEEFFSLPEYLGIYLLGGLTGSLLSLAIPNLISVGASGAIFGIFGACIIYTRRSVRQSILGALVYAFFLLFISSGQGVNNFAHLGGLLVGLIIGYILAGRRKPTTQYTVRYSYSPI